jgi:hypothetical protein
MEFREMVVTCKTVGCENKDVSITVNVPDEPNPRVICGPCGNEITDKVDA